jgi:arylsulfatase A-like enzyme
MIVYNVEPFRAALRQGEWKMIWRTLLPESVDLYNLAEDPSEKNNLASVHPDKVAGLQRRVRELAKVCAKPLFLVDQFKVVLTNMNGEPVMPTDEEYAGFESP